MDRRQVEGGQPSQPSRTNRPCGLIPPHPTPPSGHTAPRPLDLLAPTLRFPPTARRPVRRRDRADPSDVDGRWHQRGGSTRTHPEPGR